MCGPCPIFAGFTLAFALQQEKARKNLGQGSRRVPAGTINLGRVRAVPHLCGFYPGICLTTEEKARKNLGQGSRRVPAGTINLEECGPCPIFAGFTLAFTLQLRKKHGETSLRVAEECQLARSVWKSAGRAPALRVLPWYLPYNWGKSTEKPLVRVAEKWHSLCGCLWDLISEIFTRILDISHSASYNRAKWNTSHDNFYRCTVHLGIIKVTHSPRDALYISLIKKKRKGKVFPLQAPVWPRGWVEV